jgi:hypothetical protein
MQSPRTDWQNAAEIAKEIVVDLRSELPRVDARAAAGVALTAAILVGVVSQAPASMPIYAVAVAAAAMLTIALLLFLLVLLPSPTLLSHQWLLQATVRSRIKSDLVNDSGATVGGAARHRRKREAELERLDSIGRRVADELLYKDRTEYLATVAVQIAAQLRAKQRILLLAFVIGSLGVATLAFGASWALLLGWR